jgi:hypothetical protein
VSVRRLQRIPGFNIDRVAAAAGDDPDVLRLENLDTDIPPPSTAVEATRAATGEDHANSWLPFTAATTSRRPWQPRHERLRAAGRERRPPRARR